ncbi:PREDICTED: uncharacterized protein LOC105128816 isoform X1 [Populus euphratica]|uniref:Uncharacterized protein LOC105128816 isoform X1 n=1 Tax=Populus euphratica TaxID=75702 RepID=A0AAJ6XS30_POPEU|nr:PREDICTED: uncharacterized protein LOC105128816 isoform X1 [Populus euphratica]
MASSFDRWEKDPFFSAAEEVQESADRMESTYRAWIHSKKEESSMWDSEQLCRDLHTALGTTKWQLEEFARAVGSSYVKSSVDDARDRHRDFIVAIEDHILRIENSLKECALSEGKTSLPWVHLDEGECNELALFLSGPPTTSRENISKYHVMESGMTQEGGEESTPHSSKNLTNLVMCSSLEPRDEKLHGHRRTASASADIGAWKIAIAEDVCLSDPCNEKAPIPRPPRKVPSLSGIVSSMESVSKFNWPKNGVRKWKAMDCQQESDTIPLQSSQLTRGIDACYEKSKSCLDSYNECYDKQIYGWYGAMQRQLQRSQYQMQYSRPVQAALSVVFLFCLTVLIVLRAI